MSGSTPSDSIAVDGTNNSSDITQVSLDIRNAQGDIPVRLNRKGGRVVVAKGVPGGIRSSRTKVQKDYRGTRAIDDGPLKQRAGEASSTFMLLRKIPASFLDRAEDFFCSEI
ncbi:hypothetical protein PR202_ga29307 [Eleusine coracana subsp. coracana]|uniref:Uncharacterized protein n=1 Tax=Eleusine coracana subsp. coracana TaxID=191504 RepID=A0AAV5DLB1_ELECO|nr:hypothetical protein PR202_ga29307 [Eleusine coracana subsp. coracana]